jgi:hypothetical protein
LSFKFILPFYLVISLFSSNAYCQNSNFIDSIYANIIIHDLEVLDTSKNSILHKNLREMIYRNDTISLFHPGNDKFLNTSFYPGSIFAPIFPIIIDTITNSADANYLDFIHRAFDEDTGEFLWEYEIFTIKKSDLTSQKPISINLDSMIFNNKFESWRINSIQNYDNFIELDSCHLIYQLNLHSNGKFDQFYGLDEKECVVEIDSFYFLDNQYFTRTIEHEVSVQSGRWKTNNGILYLFESGKPIFEVPYIFAENKLHLRFNDNSITILKRSGQ